MYSHPWRPFTSTINHLPPPPLLHHAACNSPVLTTLSATLFNSQCLLPKKYVSNVTITTSHNIYILYLPVHLDSLISPYSFCYRCSDIPQTPPHYNKITSAIPLASTLPTVHTYVFNSMSQNTWTYTLHVYMEKFLHYLFHTC
jgi:hypothetical protein